MKKIIVPSFPHIIHGADYNPDQWQDESHILSEDMRLMKLANMNEMTVGIFSWSCLEPQEGQFDFSFLDRAMDDIYKAGGRVILATPSGGMPIWMAEKYSEVCRVSPDGIRNGFGSRHNHCCNSSVYKEKARIINEKLAERYKNHPALIAWHISNELGGYYEFYGCYCDNCKTEFREWLKKKYGNIDNLNHEWWTSFWSHKYLSFGQIEPPSKHTDDVIHGRNLDWKRFISDSYMDFLRCEAEPLKRITPDIPITTNLMEMFTDIDYRKLSKDIDFISFDNYPYWVGNENDSLMAMKIAFNLDFMRSLKHKPFLLMESTPSLVNWHSYNKLKRPGMHALSSLQAVAHGSDSVQYFQFRKSRGCSEKLHGAVVDHCGHENTRVFNDVKNLGERLKKLDCIVGTVTNSDVAIFHSIENQWAVEDSRGYSNIDKKYTDTLFRFYNPLWKRGINTDIIGAKDDFSQYKLIILPMLYMVDDVLQKKLCNYVKNGGTLLSTYMLGTVNENDLCHLSGLPVGQLKEVFGIWNEEIDTLYPDEQNTVKAEWGKNYTATNYCELIHLKGAKALAYYDSDFYKDYPAFTENTYGLGKAYYVSFFDDGIFADDIIGKIISDINVKPCFDGELPNGVTAHTRTDGVNTYLFLENYNYFEVTIHTDDTYKDVENEKKVEKEFCLAPTSSMILKR